MSEISAEMVRDFYRRQGQQLENGRIMALLEIMHMESGQTAHIDKPSGVCKTCRTVALIKGETDVL